MTNSNGCLMQAGLILSWGALIFIIMSVFAFSVTWGFVFLALVIIVKIATQPKKEIRSNDQENTAKIKTNSRNNHNVNKQKNNYISNEYFINITKEVEKIISLYEQLCKDKMFLQKLEDNTNLQITINGTNADIAAQIRILFLVDMTKCFLDLGHELNFKSKEGLGLFYFIVRTSGLEKFEYSRLNAILTGNLCESASDYAKQIKDAIAINQAVDDVFLVSELLGKYDNDQRQKYLVSLYRYASLTAKADSIISEKEAEWLSKILSLSQKPDIGGNIVISNKEKEASINTPKRVKPIHVKTTKLKSLVGLVSVKEEIETLTNFIKIQQAREEKGLKTSSVSYHCIFTGNPGTGKTTVARIVAEIYKNLGILAKGHLVETDRSGLVAEYVGQTAVKTNKIIDTALDGVLFIDEAYSLISNSQNDYGKEAIATLLKRMEDNRDRLIVILAGYTEEMQQFIDSNPGLQSRFNRYIEFPDYSAEELYEIFEKNLKQFDYKIANEAIMPLKDYFTKACFNKDKNFGNARFVRNLFEKTIEKQANRLSKETNLTEDKLSEIHSIDISI